MPVELLELQSTSSALSVYRFPSLHTAASRLGNGRTVSARNPGLSQSLNRLCMVWMKRAVSFAAPKPLLVALSFFGVRQGHGRIDAVNLPSQTHLFMLGCLISVIPSPKVLIRRARRVAHGSV